MDVAPTGPDPVDVVGFAFGRHLNYKTGEYAGESTFRNALDRMAIVQWQNDANGKACVCCQVVNRA
jgi:hypothetical protein